MKRIMVALLAVILAFTGLPLNAVFAEDGAAVVETQETPATVLTEAPTETPTEAPTETATEAETVSILMSLRCTRRPLT